MEEQEASFNFAIFRPGIWPWVCLDQSRLDDEAQINWIENTGNRLKEVKVVFGRDKNTSSTWPPIFFQVKFEPSNSCSNVASNESLKCNTRVRVWGSLELLHTTVAAWRRCLFNIFALCTSWTSLKTCQCQVHGEISKSNKQANLERGGNSGTNSTDSDMALEGPAAASFNLCVYTVVSSTSCALSNGVHVSPQIMMPRCVWINYA